MNPDVASSSLVDHPKLRNKNGKSLIGIEIGVQEGKYSEIILNNWKSCSKYIMIDAWTEQPNYYDRANVPTTKQLELYEQTKRRLRRIADDSTRNIELVYYRNYSSDAVTYIEDNSIDFIFIDARHDYCGVEEDIRLYWDKLKPGGLLTGHDYLQQSMLTSSHSGQRWDICSNSSMRVRSVKGAVDDFIDSHGLRGVASYADGAPWLSWLVRKPCKVMEPFDFLL